LGGARRAPSMSNDRAMMMHAPLSVALNAKRAEQHFHQ